ncbi:MAG: sugar O-acetyltransferase [Pseudomonadota bacterium]
MKTEKEKMLDGLIYNPDNIELVNERLNAQRLTRLYNQTIETDRNSRTQLLKELLGSFGNTIYIKPPFRCNYGSNIKVGENFFANYDCLFLDDGRITIGDNCFIAPGVHLYTTNHPLNAQERLTGVEYTKPINIGHNVWIGGRSIINPGVTLGNNVVVASGSVVTKNVPDNVLVGGNPAKIIKTLDV